MTTPATRTGFGTLHEIELRAHQLRAEAFRDLFRALVAHLRLGKRALSAAAANTVSKSASA